MANDPSTQAPEQFTPAQLSDGTILHFKGQLNPDQVRDKVAEFRFKQSAKTAQPGDPAYAVNQARQALPKPTKMLGDDPWNDGGDANVGEVISGGLQKAANRVGASVDATDQQNLHRAATGQPVPPIPWSTTGPRMVRSALQSAATLTKPSNVALAAGVTAANTNPFTAIPVDSAIVGHGLSGMYQHRQALKDFATTGNANPDELEAGLNSGAETFGGAAGLKGARATLKPTVPEQNVAIQKSLDPGWGKRQAFQNDVEGARPYLGGRKIQGVSDLQQTIPGAKNEIWKPYEDALGRFGHEQVEGPNGPTTFGDLEARRVELSNQLHSLNSKDPVAAQTIISQGKTPAQLLEEQNAVEGLIDERMRQEGVNSGAIRRTIGNVKGVERQVSGTNTLSEEPQRYGFGRMAQDLDINPFRPFKSIGNTVKGVVAGTKDLAAGRPAWSGKPTDVGVAEGLQSSAEKPDFRTTASPQPLGPQPAPPGPSGPPPPVPSEFAIEGTGRPTNANITSQGRRASAQVTQLPTEHPGNGDYAGLLPGPPAPFVPPPPRPSVPQVGLPPSVGFPPKLPNQMWDGGQPTASFNSPQQMVATPPPNSHLPFEAPAPSNPPVETQSQTPFYSGSKNAANVYPGSVSFHPPVAPPTPPAIPSNGAGATPPSAPPAAPNVSAHSSASASPVLPPVPASPINPQEVADYSQLLGRPVTANEIPAIRARLDADRNIASGLSGNRSDQVGNIREAHRATLARPKDQKR